MCCVFFVRVALLFNRFVCLSAVSCDGVWLLCLFVCYCCVCLCLCVCLFVWLCVVVCGCLCVCLCACVINEFVCARLGSIV